MLLYDGHTRRISHDSIIEFDGCSWNLNTKKPMSLPNAGEQRQLEMPVARAWININRCPINIIHYFCVCVEIVQKGLYY